MWQPPLNKHLFGNTITNPYSDDTQQQQQDELAANLLHLQKLHLTELMPPLTTTSSLYPNQPNAHLMLPNPTDFPATTISPAFINHLQQYIKSRGAEGDGVDVDGFSNRTTTAISPSVNHHLSFPTATESSTSTYLPLPTPLLPPATTANLPASTVLDMSLEIFTEALLRLNRLPHKLAQTIPQLLTVNTSTNTAPATTSVGQYISGSSNRTGPTILPSLLLSPPSPHHYPQSLSTLPLSSTNLLQSSHHLNIFKQYLTLEQQQYLMNLNNSAYNLPKTYSITSSPITNGYYSASMNSNQLIASSPTTSATRSSKLSPSLSSIQDQQRALRKRRDDLKNLFKKPAAIKMDANVCSIKLLEAVEQGVAEEKITDKTDELLLPPPKKKWIRHYLKGIHSYI